MDVLGSHIRSDTDTNEFYFESGHLALRGNPDYSEVLKTIAVLQAQRIQATKDIDKIAIAERAALDDPETFVQNLLSGEEINVPGPISPVDVPKVNFEKYNVVFPDLPEETKKENTIVSDMIVRGRVFDQSKPETFNQLWTCEEQRRLEELLVEYPPEPIEMRRFTKIANALGNRTAKQVASRVQKFFKKLHSAGMPVPGRLPKTQRPFLSKPHRINKHSLRPSTFFPTLPVIIPEDDDVSGGISLDQLFQQKSSTASGITLFERDQTSGGGSGLICVDEESNIEDGDNNLDLKTLKLLQRVRRDKEKNSTDRPNSEHVDFQCSFCWETPIIGTRWHCTTCTQDSIDFCSDCLISQILSNNSHPVSHKFCGLRIDSNQSQQSSGTSSSDSEGDDAGDYIKINSENFVYDKDYISSKFAKQEEYNYMDPNFLPE